MLIVLQKWVHIYIHHLDEPVTRFFGNFHTRGNSQMQVHISFHLHEFNSVCRAPSHQSPPCPNTIGREEKERESNNNLKSEADLVGHFSW